MTCFFHGTEERVGYCRPVSRVLSNVAIRTVISLGMRSPALSSSLPAASLSRWATSRCLFGLAPTGVYRATPVASRAVSSYLAISPLPVCRKPAPSAVCFLLHYPSMSCDIAQVLPGSAPSGARTFLEHFPMLATIQPTVSMHNIAGDWYHDDANVTVSHRLMMSALQMTRCRVRIVHHFGKPVNQCQSPSLS